MKASPTPPWRARWNPHQLGSSLPIAGPLRSWGLRLLLAAAAAALLVFLVTTLWIGRMPSSAAKEGRDPAAVDRAREVLAGVELEPWRLGTAPEQAPLPPFPAPRPAPAWRASFAGDGLGRDGSAAPPGYDAVLAALARGEELEMNRAAAFLSKAAEERPRAWALSYNAGAAFLRTPYDDRARGVLKKAWEALDEKGSDAQRAAAIHTRYAWAQGWLGADCITSIELLKPAIGLMPRLAEKQELTFDSMQPFALAPGELSNLDVWGALVDAYRRCESRYPEDFYRRNSGASRFRASEYSRRDDPRITGGPFPTQLAACVDSDGETARCWMLSNLNELYRVNAPLIRSASPGASPAPSAGSSRGRGLGGFEPHRDDLARLAYQVAWMLAERPDDGGRPAGAYLAEAVRLAGSGSGGRGGDAQRAELAERIDALASYLGSEYGDYNALAVPHEARPPESMDFRGASDLQAKGMAWALGERWQGQVAAGDPARPFAEADELRARLSPDQITSLDGWREEARESIGAALAREITAQRRVGNRQLAAGLARLRGPFLGEDWPERARDAWVTPGERVARWALWVGLGTFVLALVVFYRRVLYPYYLYTSDFYLAEFARRQEVFRRDGLALTGEEIHRRRRSRDGDDFY